MLRAEQIVKRYGDLTVLKGVNLEVAKAEIVSIVGSSGAGKSTLLHILGTLDSADSGSIIISNTHIGFVFQFHHLLPEFSALENVCIPGWLAGSKKAAVEERARYLLGTLGLADRADHKPHTLSGGEAQRVAVARALINRPDVVFADEPTGNLDSIRGKELHDLFLQLRADLGQTFVIVTHNEELAQMSDRIIHMKDGLVSEDGNIKDLPWASKGFQGGSNKTL
jgi:lipoprotein-releasing system ATP-binding protein